MLLLLRSIRDLNRGRGLRWRSLEALQFSFCFLPRTRFFLGGEGRVGITVERKNVLAQFRRRLNKVVLRQVVEQMRVGAVGESVLAGMSHSPGIEIGIGQTQFLFRRFGEQAAVIV